jgi:hypothetical protein
MFKQEYQEMSSIPPHTMQALCKKPIVVKGGVVAKAAAEEMMQIMSASGLCIIRVV